MFMRRGGFLIFVVVGILLAALLLTSIWSLIEGIKNRSRFIFGERIKYYFIVFLISAVVAVVASWSSPDKEIGLLTTVVITITLIFGNLIYYTRIEKVKNILELKFRFLKYLLFSIIILFLNLMIFG